MTLCLSVQYQFHHTGTTHYHTALFMMKRDGNTADCCLHLRIVRTSKSDHIVDVECTHVVGNGGTASIFLWISYTFLARNTLSL